MRLQLQIELTLYKEICYLCLPADARFAESCNVGEYDTAKDRMCFDSVLIGRITKFPNPPEMEIKSSAC